MNRKSVINVIQNDQIAFEEKALIVYDYQYKHNPLYQRFISLVRYNGYRPRIVEEIPFLPIALFKSNIIKTGDWIHEEVFYSSGTTGSLRSQHYIRNTQWYLDNTVAIWKEYFNPLDQYVMLSLLPNYHANESSSLIFMVRGFMLNSKNKKASYFIDNYRDLYLQLDKLIGEGMPVVLFGVSFALLDYLNQFTHQDAENLVIIETGGMKKYQEELTRTELHMRLKEGFAGAKIISEYGMTECQSQMYCLDGTCFDPNERMRIFITEVTDPNVILSPGNRGRINIIDLANLDSMSFIATDDLGISDSLGRTEIMGRISNSDLRGCNYLI